MEKQVRAQQQFTVEEIYQYVVDLCHKRGIVFATLDDGSTELITNRSYMETSIQNAIDLLCEAGLLESATS